MANSWEWSQKDLDEAYEKHQEEKNKKMLEKLKKRKIPRYSCKITTEEILSVRNLKNDAEPISGEELFQKEMQEKFANSNPRRDEDE